jgi:hypothetical protein
MSKAERKRIHLEMAKSFLESETAERAEYIQECFRRRVKPSQSRIDGLDAAIRDSHAAIRDCEAALLAA